MFRNQEDLILNFVLKNDHQSEKDAASDMKHAYKSAVDFGIHCRWIKESDCLQADKELKGLVFVFEDFEGQIFSRFVKSHIHSRVIGPKCLLICMSEGIPIPNTKYPVVNLAMDKFSVCVSGVSLDQKKEIEKLVGYMGGRFSNKFLTSTTHLVVNSVLSEKCFKAREAGIPIVTTSWVEDVWKRSLISRTNIEGTENMINEYKVPIFYNLKMTVSGMSEKEKNEISKNISCNGGTYTPEMRKETNILILPVGRGEKFRFAERWKTKCLSPSWIECCLKEGYAVRYENYVVKSADKKCSTPVSTCINGVSLMNANDSDISVIPCDSARTVIGDTQCDSPLTIRKQVFKTPVKCAPTRDNSNGNSPKIDDCTNYQALLNDMAVTDVKKCGTILDGCKVYLAGFQFNEEEKLRRLLNYGGAIRYTELNDSVTHVIVGNPCKNELENIKAVNHPLHVVSLRWLSTSIKKGSLEKESNCSYFVDDKAEKPQRKTIPQQPSPLSKKGLQMLNPIREISTNNGPLIDHELLEKYSRTLDPAPCEMEPVAERSNAAHCEDLTRDRTTQSSITCSLFAGLKFTVIGYEPRAMEEIRKMILDCGGIIIEDSSIANYIILPIEQPRKVSHGNGAAEIVTSVWIQECFEENRILDVKYHHRPLIVSRPLAGTSSHDYVITFSSYSVYQKQYLEQVATFLGARFQNVLSKKEAPERNIARTTHLVCATPQGVKYNAAKKWNLPVISEKWLLDSFNQRKVLPLDFYLLREDDDNQSEKTSNSVQDDRTGMFEKGTTTTKEMTIEETKNHAPNNRTDTVEKVPMNSGKQVKTIAKRSSYTIPALTEAVKSTDNRAFNLSGRQEKTPETKDYPHGVLAQFNRHASSIMKRKSDDENELMALQTGSQKRKILRSDATRTSSSQDEGVGWQDTFTDNDHSQHRTTNADAAVPSSSADTDDRLSDDVEQNQRWITDNQNDEQRLSVSQPRSSRTRTDQLFRSQPTYRNIMISVNTKEKKEKCETIIEGLGGNVVQRYDPDCQANERVTHLIIDDLKKTEKLLCSLASGLWVLHSSYLEMCKEKNEFVKEEPFEWGNPLRTSLPGVKESKDSANIAKAAYRWRTRIRAGGPSSRPFVGMRAVIVNSSKDEPLQSLIRVVKSGGGRILNLIDVLESTHVLVLSVKNTDSIPVPLEKLAQKKIHYLPAVYLSDYLINDPPPTPESCYFDAYKRFF